MTVPCHALSLIINPSAALSCLVMPCRALSLIFTDHHCHVYCVLLDPLFPQPHSTAFVGFGAMLLYVGFLFFNGGSGLGRRDQGIKGSVHPVALAVVNTGRSGGSDQRVATIAQSP